MDGWPLNMHDRDGRHANPNRVDYANGTGEWKERVEGEGKKTRRQIGHAHAKAPTHIPARFIQ